MRYSLVIALLLIAPGLGQTTKTGEAKTSGSCSPAVTGNNNQFTISCQGITSEQGQEFLRILNRILSNELDPKAVMDKLDEIEKEVKKGNNGVWSGYDFNGAKRVESPGRSMVTAGPEISIFQQMMRLNDAKDWTGLLSLAEKEIKEIPDWATPYFFSGLANARLGNRQAAIARLGTFLSGADDRVDYQNAVTYAKELLAQLQAAP